MSKQKRFTFGRAAVALVILVVCLSAGRVSYLVGDYFECLDNFSGDVSRNDQLATRADLENLQYFYGLNRKLKPWGLSWLGDRYLFREASHYGASYDYLTNRYERVVEELNNDNTLWGRYLRANAKWRLAQSIFEQALRKDPATFLKEQVLADELALSTKEDYAEAVKMSRGDWLPAKWNYDLTVDPNARMAGLMPKPAKIKVKLGMGGKKNKGLGQDKGEGPRGNGSRDLQIEGPPSPANPKPGNKRPG